MLTLGVDQHTQLLNHVEEAIRNWEKGKQACHGKKTAKPVKPVISENGYITHISRNYRLSNYILLFLVF